MRYKLLSLDRNYSVWIDWYERRIRGERAAFDIPGDKRRTEDKNILRQLAEASDEDFWDKGNHYVNATLKGWLDEARARAAPMPPVTAETHGTLEFDITAHAEIGPVPLPTQNLNSLSFRTNNEGRIAIDASALADKLRTDDDAMERHAEAISEARSALGRCQGNNAAARLTGFLENYLAAAGDSPGNAKPSLLVQRGERLRQELARYDASDHMLPPVADDVLLDLKGWQSAHNMMIALDPVLNANDTAMLGPDRQPVLIAPDEFREKVREADNQGLLAEGVVEIIDEAASLAPQTPDPTNRLSVSFGGMAQNLIIEAFACALNHPTISVVAIGAAGLISAGPAAGAIGGVSVMSSIKAAEYLINHREWIIARLGNAPTWQTLIERLVGWLETVTPFKPK